MVISLKPAISQTGFTGQRPWLRSGGFHQKLMRFAYADIGSADLYGLRLQDGLAWSYPVSTSAAFWDHHDGTLETMQNGPDLIGIRHRRSPHALCMPARSGSGTRAPRA